MWETLAAQFTAVVTTLSFWQVCILIVLIAVIMKFLHVKKIGNIELGSDGKPVPKKRIIRRKK